MSYEGFTQILTDSGHQHTRDCWEEIPTFIDGEKVVWWNMVDQTNGSWENGERIDGYVELEISKSGNVCSECGHLKTPHRYRLPPANVGHHVKD